MDNYAWLAGLLEGEGSFKKGCPSAPGKPVVTVSMTDRDVIQRVADMLGVRSFREQHWANPKWKTAYTLQISGRRAVDLMIRLRPMMGARRRAQIDAAVACWNPIWERNRERDQMIMRLHEEGKLNYTQIGAAVGITRQSARAVVRRKCMLHKH